jgi:DNA-binding CsgD family transcriptional regulator
MDAFLKEFSDLVELIYDAGANPSGWRTFLAALSNVFECASGLLHRYDPSLGSVPAFEEFGHDTAFSETYARYYASINPYPAESFHRLATGKVEYAGTLLPVSEVIGTEFYNDWMKPQGISPNHLGVVLSRTDGVMSLLCVAPQARVFDKDPKKFGDRLQMLVPHMTKALELNRVLAGATLANETSHAMLDSIPAAVFLLAAGGRVSFANRRGEELLQKEQVMTIDPVTRRLRPYALRDGGAFEAAVARARAGKQPQFMRVIAGEAGAAFILAIVPLSPRTRDVVLSSPHDGLAVIATPSSGHVELRIEDIRDATGLSQAEARLAKALVSGASLHEYADAAGLSPNTARRQLAAAFLKTETNKQSDLVSLLVRAIGVVSVD